MSGCNSFNIPGDCCNNPCRVTRHNSAQCEDLPSQIQNFTLQFFGTIVKSEVDGAVTWSLPCNLDVGLPNNPRGTDEGLACYFLRLFMDGIVGLTGPQGEQGTPGTNGNNAYTVTVQGFVQPAGGSPVTVITASNPAIAQSIYIFIDGSGWYLVNTYDAASGAAFLTLVRSIAPAGTVIACGKLVIPSGYPGATGAQGNQGPQGIQGIPGVNFASTNAFYNDPFGTDFKVQGTYLAVDFTTSAPRVLLPSAGRYLLTAVIDVSGLTGIATSDSVSFKLVNTTTSADVGGSEHFLSGLISGQRSQVSINAIVETASDNNEVGIYANASTSDRFSAVALGTSYSLVRLS